VNQELKLAVKPAMTYKLTSYVVPKDWSSGLDYFGSTVKSSAQTLIGSLITPSSTGTNPSFTFNIGNGLFVGTGTAISGSLSIVGWSATGTSFSIAWSSRNP